MRSGNRRKVLITSTPEAFNRIKGKIRSAGFIPAYLRTIEIKPAAFRIKADDYNWVIFTSRHGVDFFMRKAPAGFLKGKRTAVIGSETAKAAKRRGLKISFLPEKFDSRSFAGGFINAVSGRTKVLLVSPVKGGEELKSLLEHAGIIVDRVPVYRTALPRKNMAKIEKFMSGRPYYFAVFSSPSTFVNFVRILGKKSAAGVFLETHAAAIGGVTAGEMKKAGIKPVVVPKTQTLAGVIDGIKKFSRSGQAGLLKSCGEES